jgi:hypothetical protein
MLDWPSAQATILSAQVRTIMVRKNLRYTPYIVYEYQAPQDSDKKFKSSGFQYMRLRTADQGECQAFVDRFPVGSVHTCYVDPLHAEMACLSRSYPEQFTLNSLFALSLGMVFGLLTVKSLTEIRKKQAQDASLSPRPLVLVSPSTKKADTFIPPLVFFLLLVPLAIAGRGNDILTIPAELVEASLGVVILQCALSTLIFFRRWQASIGTPRLALDGPVILGGEETLHWEIPASFGYIGRVNISLLAQEYMPKRRFRKNVPIAPYGPMAIVNVDKPIQRTGSSVLALPRAAAATIDFPLYKIKWSLCIEVRDSRGRARSFTAPIAVHWPPRSA